VRLRQPLLHELAGAIDVPARTRARSTTGPAPTGSG
jgi:hypothetical protein